MDFGAQMLLLLAVGGVGVLHTMVPDHWLPIALLAREQGWSRAETLRAAVQAGAGHAASTLIIALIVWIAGVAFARHFGHAVDVVSSLALIGFGGWIMLSASRELRAPQGHQHRHETRFTERDGDHHHHHETYDLNPDPESDPLYLPLRGDVVVLTRHIHVHRHGSQVVHAHWHDHTAQSSHELTEAEDAEPPLHEHRHRMKRRTALLLILGSSPMVEGIPAFFAAGRYGFGLILTMAGLFALCTIATYALLCVCSAAGLQRVRLGPIERHGEVLSGAFIAIIGLVFGLGVAF